MPEFNAGDKVYILHDYATYELGIRAGDQATVLGIGESGLLHVRFDKWVVGREPGQAVSRMDENNLYNMPYFILNPARFEHVIDNCMFKGGDAYKPDYHIPF